MSKTAVDTPVHVIEVGAIRVHIHRASTPDGFSYLYYQPGRVTARSDFAQRFFERDDRDLAKAVTEAAAWIRKNPQAADEPPDPGPVSSPRQLSKNGVSAHT